MNTIKLTDGEAFDAASIVRNYARTIREDVAKMKAEEKLPGYKYAPTPPAMFTALIQAAEQREQLANKLDGGDDA